MNRAQRRMHEKAMKAMGVEIARMEKPDAYRQGYLDGGQAMTRVCYAAFAEAMAESGFAPDTIAYLLRDMEERILIFAGEEEKQKTAWTDAGLEICMDEPFAEDRITLKK